MAEEYGSGCRCDDTGVGEMFDVETEISRCVADGCEARTRPVWWG